MQALATRLLITESVWLKRLVMRALGESAASLSDTIVIQREPERYTRDARLYVRLRLEDRLLLRERATARGMAPATYASVLMRVTQGGVHGTQAKRCRARGHWPESQPDCSRGKPRRQSSPAGTCGRTHYVEDRRGPPGPFQRAAQSQRAQLDGSGWPLRYREARRKYAGQAIVCRRRFLAAAYNVHVK